MGGSSGFVGMSMGIMSKTVPSTSPLLYLPLVLWLSLAGAMTFWVLRKNKQQCTWTAESRNIMTQLVVARWQGNLRQYLGQDQANLLNSAAEVLMRCRTTLDNPAWKAASGSEVWSQMRDKASRSMESAMARMLLLVTANSHEEAKVVLADMKSLDDEVTKAARRHASVTGESLGGTDALRQTLSEMRELASADEEYLEDRLP